MKSRILLKEIPTGKFHSAIFTTYSINLYYLEQQVLPLLDSKDIHYVSILADGAMLSTQLAHYGFLSQQRKRNYALHGIQSSGAFHPKLIFLAGTDSVLLLVGSGNLSTSGHGKNLEVWNAVYINSLEDTKYGFIVQAWNYMKQLHADLGNSANSKLKSIEENCFLLANVKKVESTIFDLDENTQISFHANQKDSSLFSQVSNIVGNDKINRITIMCPFHDLAGEFIKQLNKRYNPGQIDVLVQSDFGALPIKMKNLSNVSFYEWTEVMQEKQRQSYFHAKNIIIEGKNKNYLISGSANASIAAFGTMTIPATNQESCVIYQSTDSDYLELLSIKITGNPVLLKDYETQNESKLSDTADLQRNVFIKSVEKNFDTVYLIYQVIYPIKDGIIQLFDPKRTVQYEERISLESGEHFQQISIPNGVSSLFAQISIQGVEASNKQFITDINAFESTNPSPRNRSLNQIRKLIESGNFSTPKIIDYLNTIYRQKEIKKGISKPSEQEELIVEIPKEEEDDLLYLSYAEIQERSKYIDNQEKIYHYIDYKGVRLWDSIFSYLKESREREIQSKIDEEETEDINNSGGRSEKKDLQSKRSIPNSKYEKLRDKVIKYLDSYYDILYQKTHDNKCDQPTLIDLSMYLIMLEILLHLLGHKENIDEVENPKYLLQITYSKLEYSWSEYLIQYIGMFTMWCNQKHGFKDVDNLDYRNKVEQYKSMAFKTSLSALVIYNILNKNYDLELHNQWIILSLLNSNKVFNNSITQFSDVEDFLSFIPKTVLEDISEVKIEEEIDNIKILLSSTKIKDKNLSAGDIYYLSGIGYTFLDKVIKNPNNTFYKLFTPAFEWDDEVINYWNGQVYSIREKRWLKSRKE
jgi:hypothetical protein